MHEQTALAELEHAIERAALYRAQHVRLSLDAARTLRTLAATTGVTTAEEPTDAR